MIDSGTFQTYLQVKTGSEDTWLLQPTLDTAQALVDSYVGFMAVPESVKDRAVLVCGAELWNQRKAPSGITQFADFESGQGLRVARDPLTGVYPLLRQYTGPGIA